MEGDKLHKERQRKEEELDTIEEASKLPRILTQGMKHVPIDLSS